MTNLHVFHFRKVKPLLTTGFIALILYVSLIAFLYIQQRNFIYFPDQTRPDKTIMNAEKVVQDISVTTQDGLNLSAWFIPPSTRSKPVILLFHGNAGNISHRLFKVSDYANAGYGLLLAEYRGYGGNPSSPNEDGFYKDARAYFSWLHQRGYKNRDIILYGESLGTGVAVQMAKEYPVKAIILEAPYARLSDPARKTYFFIPFIDALMHDKFHSVDKIGSVTAPKLFIIAGKDEVLGAQTGLNLYEAAREPKSLKLFDNAQHNTLHQYNMSDIVIAFLSAL